MVVYTNADFISLNEENLTYSVLVEDKGKIAYIGYNTPLCYRDAKVVDLEGKAVLPAVNDLIPVDCKDAGCAVLAGDYLLATALVQVGMTRNHDIER